MLCAPTSSTARISESLLSANWRTWKSFNAASLDYWSRAVLRGATPYDLASDLVEWTTTITDRHMPQWAHENRVVREWPLARLRDFSSPDADPDMAATVILPPQAGHHSCIVDFGDDQSQVMTAREHGCQRVFVLEWIGATQETKDAEIDEYMSILRETAAECGGPINLVGDCQGGWLATIFAAAHPELMNSLTIAGAPIDFSAGEALTSSWVDVLAPESDMSFYRSAVEANDGLLPGRFLLDGFKALRADQEVSRNVQLLANLHDEEHVERYRHFEDWFQWTQPLPGAFYLWIVEHLFSRNSLIKGELIVEGRKVDLGAIDCPLFLLAADADHITPPDQVWQLANYVSTPASQIGRQALSGGHLGIFMGHDALQNHWPLIFAEIAGLSTPDPRDTPEALTDEPSGTVSEKANPSENTGVQSKTSASEKSEAQKTPTAKPTTEAKAVKAAGPSAKTSSGTKTSGSEKTEPQKTSAAKSQPTTKAKSTTSSQDAKPSTTKSTSTPKGSQKK